MLSCPVLYVAAPHDFSANAQQQAGHCNFEASRLEYWCAVAGWTWMVAALKHPLAPWPGAVSV